MARPDAEAHAEGLAQFLTAGRRQLIGELQDIAVQMGSIATLEQIGIAAEERYGGNHHITQLLVRKNLKQCEFAEALAGELTEGRTTVALAVTRTLLEGAVELAWAADGQLRGTPQDRLFRILRRGYEALGQVSTLPPAEQAVLDQCLARELKVSPGSPRSAMQEMDAAEVRAGGQPYWESHYQQFAISSDVIHASFLGPARFTIVGDEMHVDMNPGETEGAAALRWGLFYFVRGADAVFRLVGLDDDSQKLVARYAAIKQLADDELKKTLRD